MLLLAVPALSGFAAEPAVRLPNQELPLERYVAGVIAGEAGVLQSDAALQAMAVAARTYAVRLRGRHIAAGYDFCTTTHCQRVELQAVTPRIESAAAATAGELLWFEGKPAFTPYARDCGGRAEDAAAVWPDMAAPYLKSHDDPYCPRASWTWNADPEKAAQALQNAGLRAPRRIESVAIARRTASGRAATLVLSGAGESVRISAGSFRFAIGRELEWNTVLSDRYEIAGRVFRGFGSGHGVGLCQHGAEQMGLQGRSYREILGFYYPGTAVGITARGISWQTVSGDGMTLLMVHPDTSILGLAGRELRTLTARTGWTAPAEIEIRVYPDLDSFRDATGEPGWAAAHTAGRRIHLQPANLLRSRNALEETLRHELLHVLVEAQSSAALPLWFREGLVEYLGHRLHTSGAARIPAEADLRQTADPARARQAYADAARAVAGLVDRYGETAVLIWLKRGLPDEVRNASNSQAATQRK